MPRAQFLSAVYMIIRNENNEILLQRRCGSKLWPGFLALPAGHIDEKENPYDALIREAKEELDITLDISDIKDTFVACRYNKSLMPYYDIYFELKSYKGNIKINEKDKCLELKWVNINNLPDDMIDFEIDAINKYLNNIKFSYFYADNEKKVK